MIEKLALSHSKFSLAISSLSQNSYNFFQENTFENIVCNLAAILFRHQKADFTNVFTEQTAFNLAENLT